MRSDNESYSTPNSLELSVKRADVPSRTSNTIAIRIAIAAVSNRSWNTNTTAANPP